MKRQLCGFSRGEELLNSDSKLREISQAWKEADGSTERCDRDKAGCAVRAIYERMMLSAPVIRWWNSPIAMIGAHEVHTMGLLGARTFYGDAVFGISEEFASWLDSSRQPLVTLGRPVGLRSCGCSKQPGWASALDCPRHRVLIGRRLPASILDQARELSTVDRPCRLEAAIEGAIADAFCLSLELTYRGDEDWWLRQERSIFTSAVSMWPAQEAATILGWQFTAALSPSSLEGSCIAAYVDLAQSTHLAILRERECWLSDRPTMSKFDALNRLHANRGPALAYADGTLLYANAGNLLPAQYVQYPDRIPLDVIDGISGPFRRENLIELYGVERYLMARHATIEELSELGTLWILAPGIHGACQVLEVPNQVGPGALIGRTYYQLPNPVGTLCEALIAVENSGGNCQFMIHVPDASDA